MKKKLFLTCLAVLGTVLAGCGEKGTSSEGSSQNQVITPTAVAINGAKVLKVGETLQLSAVVSPTGASQEVTWTSLDESKATVTASGLVNAVAEGTVKIRATSKVATTVSNEVTLTIEKATISEGVTPNKVVRTLEDDRELAYGAFTPTGEEMGKFPSMYEAINATVDEGDRGSYVTKLADDQKDIKLFVNYDAYDADMGDQFWYYQNGNQLSAYVPWSNTYFQDSKDLQATVIMNSPSDGVLTYYNGYELLYTNPNDATSNGLAVWSIQKFLESAATANLAAYSGITKVEYEIDLSGVKFAPSLNENQPTEAFFGFYSTDSYNTSHQHLRADTRTGDWYYGVGENNFDGSSDTFAVDKSVALMTSTWHDEGYFTPDEARVNVTFEKLTLVDNEGGDYIVDRITFEFPESGRKVVRNYENSALTQCGTIRFINGLDIMTGGVVAPDYLNGSYFNGLTVTKATAHAFEDMQDPSIYGNVALLDAGVYDVLNANEASEARFQTIMYNPAFNSLDTSAGKDVYSHSYTADPNNSAYNNNITNVKTLLNALPANEDIVEADEPQIVAARTAHDGLHLFEKSFITTEEYGKLTDAEVALLIAKDPEQGSVMGVLQLLGNVMDYTKYADIAAKKTQVEGLVDAFNALSESKKEQLGEDVATRIADWNKAVSVPEDPTLAQHFTVLFDVVLGRTFDGQTLGNWDIDSSGYIWGGDGDGLNSLVYVAGRGRKAIDALKAQDLYKDLPSGIINNIEVVTTNASGKTSFAMGLRFLRAYGDVCDILDQIAAQAGWMAAWEITFADYPGYANDADINVNKNGQDTTNLDFTEIRPQLDKIAEYWNAEGIETWNFKNSVENRTVTVVRRWDAYLKPILADARCPYVLSGHGLALKAE